MGAYIGAYIAGIVAIAAVATWWGIRNGVQRHQRQQATLLQQCLQFRKEREHLEAKLAGAGRFAAIHGLPCWQDITFDDPVFFLRDRRTAELIALVAILLEIRSPDPAKPSDICFRELGGRSDPTEDYSRASFAAETLAQAWESLRERGNDGEIPLEMAEDGPYRWRFRDATAIFRYREGAWTIDARVLSDLSPEEVIQYHGDQFRLVHEWRPTGTDCGESTMDGDRTPNHPTDIDTDE